MDAIDFGTLPAPAAQPMSDQAPFLTFADVSSYIAAGSHIGMWTSGCLLDDGTHNCTQVCQNSSLLYRQPSRMITVNDDDEYTNTTEMIADFRVTYNIYNCMMYPYISSLLTNSHASPSARSNAQQLANEMHVLPGGNDTDSVINNTRKAQWDCVEEFCYASTTCAQGLTPDDFEKQTLALQSGPGLSQDPSYNFPDWSRISTRASMNVYTDIAGIGVSIAFYIQAGIILMCWLYTCFHRCRRYLSSSSHKEFRNKTYPFTQRQYIPRVVRRGFDILYNERPADPTDTPITPRTEKSFSKLSKSSSRTSRVHVRETIISAICSFQSAQCFFLLSMNIAILIGLATPGPFMTSSSLGQFYNNLLYTQAVAQGAAAFVCSTQYCLYIIGKGSPYFLLLTILTFATSAATFGLAHSNDTHLNASRLQIVTADPKHDYWQVYCGMVSPQTYNGSLGRNVIFGLNVNPYILGISILTFASAIIVGLAGGMYWRLHIQRKHDNRHTRCKVWYLRVFFVYSVVIEFCAWGWIIVFIIFFWNPMYSVLPKSWSLGQVLAVSIWVPGLFEWIHAAAKLIEPKIMGRFEWYSRSSLKEDWKKSQARPTDYQQTLPLSSRLELGPKRGSLRNALPLPRTESPRVHSRAPSEVPLLERNDVSTATEDERSTFTRTDEYGQ